MWILWLILSVNGQDQTAFIERYVSEQACRTAQVYVQTEMQKAYPDDTRLRLVCRPQAI